MLYLSNKKACNSLNYRLIYLKWRSGRDSNHFCNIQIVKLLHLYIYSLLTSITMSIKMIYNALINNYIYYM